MCPSARVSYASALRLRAPRRRAGKGSAKSPDQIHTVMIAHARSTRTIARTVTATSCAGMGASRSRRCAARARVAHRALMMTSSLARRVALRRDTHGLSLGRRRSSCPVIISLALGHSTARQYSARASTAIAGPGRHQCGSRDALPVATLTANAWLASHSRSLWLAVLVLPTGAFSSSRTDRVPARRPSALSLRATVSTTGDFAPGALASATCAHPLLPDLADVSRRGTVCACVAPATGPRSVGIPQLAVSRRLHAAAVAARDQPSALPPFASLASTGRLLVSRCDSGVGVLC